MERDALRARFADIGIIPSVRVSSAADARFAAETVAHAGIPIVEITMTMPHALEIIADLAGRMPDLIVEAGSVFDVTTARRCVDAGARFVTSPGLDVRIVEFASHEGIVSLPGALTPTEVTAAWQARADFVKVFPCAQVGGPSYIHALKAPFPNVPFVAGCSERASWLSQRWPEISSPILAANLAIHQNRLPLTPSGMSWCGALSASA